MQLVFEKVRCYCDDVIRMLVMNKLPFCFRRNCTAWATVTFEGSVDCQTLTLKWTRNHTLWKNMLKTFSG